MPNRRELSHGSPPHWQESVQRAIRWRPSTLLDYLLLIAGIGIVLALVVIIGVEVHLLHRLS